MILILIILLVINITVLVGFILMFWGAPYVPSRNASVENMMKMGEIGPGQKVADLGSGDGRVVIAMARRGAEAHGYDNDPLLVLLARRNIRRAGLSGKAFIHWKNLWKTDLSSFDAITVYGIPYMMKPLKEKLQKEMRHGSKVISNAFPFPQWQEDAKNEGVYLYQM